MKLRDEGVVVGFLVDAEDGELIGFSALADRDRGSFLRWLSEDARRLGVEALVTDDPVAYRPVVEELGVDRRACIAHVRKSAWNRLKKMEGWDWVKARLWRLLEELPEWGGRELVRLESLVREHDELRRLVELTEKWRSLVCWRRVAGMPQTNNCSERGIGGSKACVGLDPVSGTDGHEAGRARKGC